MRCFQTALGTNGRLAHQISAALAVGFLMACSARSNSAPEEHSQPTLTVDRRSCTSEDPAKVELVPLRSGIQEIPADFLVPGQPVNVDLGMRYDAAYRTAELTFAAPFKSVMLSYLAAGVDVRCSDESHAELRLPDANYLVSLFATGGDTGTTLSIYTTPVHLTPAEQQQAAANVAAKDAVGRSTAPRRSTPDYDETADDTESDDQFDDGENFNDCVEDCFDMDSDGRTSDDVDADGDGRYETPP